MIVPGSKSLSNRALICAALADGDSLLTNISDSTDTAMMINGLNQFGVLARTVPKGARVTGTGGRLFAPKMPVPVGNAGTTLRFLLSLAGRAAGTTVFEGSSRMAERPMQELSDALGQLGVQIHNEEGSPRYKVHGADAPGGNVRVSGERSSQFLSSLLLSSPGLPEGLSVYVEGDITSEPYVAMTIAVMGAFGVDVVSSPGLFVVGKEARYRPANYVIEADASSATYPLAAAAIAGGRVTVPEVHRTSLQSDMGFAEVLISMGCAAEWTDEGLMMSRPVLLHGVDVDMNTMPDAVPALVAVALFAQTPTTIRKVAHLRYKESDRLGTLAEELRKAGADIMVHDDGLTVRPSILHGATFDPHDDHRLAMSFALVGLRIPGVTVLHPGCVSKSYPKFWSELESLVAGVSRSGRS